VPPYLASPSPSRGHDRVPRKSSIDRLPPKVKAAIQAQLKNGRLTLDEILDQIRVEFGDKVAPSRSALGRYKKNFDELAKDLRETREIADLWAHKFGEAPESDVGKVVLEILRTLSYRVGADLMNAGEDLDAKSVHQLAKAMQYIEDAGRLSLAREKQLRQAALEAAAEQVKTIGKKRGLSTSALDEIRRGILGIETERPRP
jgi:hypothetical protein